MLTSNTAKNHSTVATSYSAYAKAAGIFMMTTGIFLFAKTTRYLFPSFFSRKTEEDASTALITKDEIQSITSMMQDTISLNEVNGFEMGVSTGDSMATDPAENEQVQFTELTLFKSAKIKEETIEPEIYQQLQTSRRLMTLPTTDEFQINNYTTSEQSSPSVARLSNDNFVLTWMSDAQDGSSWGIYGQIFTPTGIKLGNEFLVNTYTQSQQDTQFVASLTNGNFVVAWDSPGQTGDFEIYAQLFTATGAKIGSEFQVNIPSPYQDSGPSIAGLTNENFVVGWSNFAPSQDSYGQLFTADGTKIGSEFLINTYTTSWQLQLHVAGLNNGNFVATWSSYLQDDENFNIYGQIFTPTAGAVGNAFLVNTYVNDAQQEPSVTGLSNGNFAVVWQSNLQDGSGYGIYSQIFSSAGIKMGNEIAVNTYTDNEQDQPSIAALTESNFVIVWNSYLQDGSSYGVYGQIINTAGTKVGIEFSVNSYKTNGQYRPCVAGLANNTFVVAWESSQQDGSGSGVYGKIFYTKLTATNTTQTITYREDTNYPLEEIFIIPPAGSNNLINTTLSFSNSGAGYLTTPTSGSTTSTYSTETGTWQAVGAASDLNILLSNLQFIPVENFNSNFNINVLIQDNVSPDVTGLISVTGIPVNDYPTFLSNQLTISEGQTVTLTATQLSATDVDNNNAMLIFIIRNVSRGHFELSNNPGVSITTFTQQQITDGVVQFVHDGSPHTPAYEVSVSDGELSTEFASAAITYTSMPTVSSSSSGMVDSFSSSRGSAQSSSDNQDTSNTADSSATGDASTSNHEAESSSGSNALNSSSSANTLSAAYQALIVVCSLIGTVGGAITILWAAGKGAFDACGIFARKNTERATKNKFAAHLYLALKIGNLRTKNFQDGFEGPEFLQTAEKLAADFVKKSGFDFTEYQNDINKLPRRNIIEICRCMAEVIREDKILMSPSYRVNFFGHQLNFMDFLDKLQHRTTQIAEKTKEKMEDNLLKHARTSSISMSNIHVP